MNENNPHPDLALFFRLLETEGWDRVEAAVQKLGLRGYLAAVLGGTDIGSLERAIHVVTQYPDDFTDV